MLETFQKIWKFAGDERDNINKSIVFVLSMLSSDV